MPGYFDPFTGRSSAHKRWAYEPDRTAATAPAREAFLRKLEHQVDPEGVLTPKTGASGRRTFAGHTWPKWAGKAGNPSGDAKSKRRKQLRRCATAVQRDRKW